MCFGIIVNVLIEVWAVSLKQVRMFLGVLGAASPQDSDERQKLLKEGVDKLKQAPENRDRGVGEGKGVAASA